MTAYSLSSDHKRLVAEGVLSADDFAAIAAALGGADFEARKAGLVSARLCVTEERVETRWNGTETTNTAKPFDMIVTNLDARGVALKDGEGHANTYVIKADTFPKLYEAIVLPGAGQHVYRARGTVRAVKLAGGFDIMAPWSERQVAASGYLICNGRDVYGNNAETFEATYVAVGAKPA